MSASSLVTTGDGTSSAGSSNIGVVTAGEADVGDGAHRWEKSRKFVLGFGNETDSDEYWSLFGCNDLDRIGIGGVRPCGFGESDDTSDACVSVVYVDAIFSGSASTIIDTMFSQGEVSVESLESCSSEDSSSDLEHWHEQDVSDALLNFSLGTR